MTDAYSSPNVSQPAIPKLMMAHRLLAWTSRFTIHKLAALSTRLCMQLWIPAPGRPSLPSALPLVLMTWRISLDPITELLSQRAVGAHPSRATRPPAIIDLL
jgi:hypothetical protein